MTVTLSLLAEKYIMYKKLFKWVRTEGALDSHF